MAKDLSVTQVARRYQIRRDTVYAWVRNGFLTLINKRICEHDLSNVIIDGCKHDHSRLVMKVSDVAAELGLSRYSIYNYIEEGKICALKLRSPTGKTIIRVPYDEVLTLEREMEN